MLVVALLGPVDILLYMRGKIEVLKNSFEIWMLQQQEEVLGFWMKAEKYMPCSMSNVRGQGKRDCSRMHSSGNSCVWTGVGRLMWCPT